MTRRRRQSIALIVAVVSQFYVATSQQSLETNFDGTLHASGQIFEVVAKSQAISITSFDVNMDAGTDEVSVYSRPGDLVASDDGLWLLISAFNVTGQGRGLKTSLPSFDFPVVVPAGLKQSFYVATNSTTIDFWYSTGTGTELGTVLASNDDMDVYEGYAIGNAWRGYAVPRQWNGVIYYSTGGTVTPTASPVLTTASPSTSSASAVSSQVCQYVSLCLVITRLVIILLTQLALIYHDLFLNTAVVVPIIATNEWICFSTYCRYSNAHKRTYKTANCFAKTINFT